MVKALRFFRGGFQKTKVQAVLFDQSGFSLIEMIMVIVILGIIGVYTFSFLGDTMGAYVRVKEHKTLYDEGRLAMQFMVNELRDANQNDPFTVSTSSITFTRTHPSATVITYSLSGSTLNREESGTFPLAGSVQSFTPTISGTVPSQVITLELVISGRGTVRFRTAVFPRNKA